MKNDSETHMPMYVSTCSQVPVGIVIVCDFEESTTCVRTFREYILNLRNSVILLHKHERTGFLGAETLFYNLD